MSDRAPAAAEISMRLPVFLAPFALIACALTPPEAPSGMARFPGYPQALFDAFRQSCTGPARDFVVTDRNSVECRELMPPDVTASVLLAFDGTLEDLPRLVVRFEAEPQAGSYLVSNEVFVNVPQRQGEAVRLLFTDPRLRRDVAALYARAGGVPE
jgi:hypothetical protein